MTAMILKPDVAAKIAWSPRRPPVICSVCAGPLPDVPLMMLWRQVAGETQAAAFCDRCVRSSFEVQK